MATSVRDLSAAGRAITRETGIDLPRLGSNEKNVMVRCFDDVKLSRIYMLVQAELLCVDSAATMILAGALHVRHDLWRDIPITNLFA